MVRPLRCIAWYLALAGVTIAPAWADTFYDLMVRPAPASRKPDPVEPDRKNDGPFRALSAEPLRAQVFIAIDAQGRAWSGTDAGTLRRAIDAMQPGIAPTRFLHVDIEVGPDGIRIPAP